MDQLRRKCLCERGARGAVVKRNPDCPVNHRGGNIPGPSVVPAKRKTMSDAQMALARLRDATYRLRRDTALGLVAIAGLRMDIETVRRYLDGE